MFGFNFGKKRIIGIDMGISALKLVELELRGGKPFLSNYAWMPIASILDKNNSTARSSFFEAETAEYLKKINKEAGFKTKNAYVAIPSFGGLVTLVDFPAMPLKDLDQAIKFEAHKYIPTAMEDVVTSWEIVGENKLGKDKTGKNIESNEKIQVVLVAASKKKIQKYEKIVKDGGFNVAGIEMENFSLVSSLVGKDEGNFIIVDIGFKLCNIIYVEGGVIKANRNIDAGGVDITDTISTGLNITRERAEKMKMSGQNFFGVESSLHFSSLDMIIGEITRMINTVLKENNKKVDAIILSGGTSKLCGIAEFFQKRLNVRTIMGNPFSRVGYDNKLEPVIDNMRSHFSIATGLALKGMENMMDEK